MTDGNALKEYRRIYKAGQRKKWLAEGRKELGFLLDSESIENLKKICEREGITQSEFLNNILKKEV